ncbi:MAG: hypothetical protein COB62_07240 [Piscirickettsiaceae bacterium]|nr:MAG: hypothetical protein COB62_07240 [Piscirickettsiaceae bacterium]
MLNYKFIILTLVCFFTYGVADSVADDAPWVGQSLKGAPCRGNPTAYGPFDYLLRSQYKYELHLVESTHFLPEIENLIKGHSGPLQQEFDYTIRAWPNHHRALNSITRFKLLYPKKSRKLQSPVECYFQRAINFSPKDATTRMLYGIYLHKIKHYKMANSQYKDAVKLSPNNPIIRYNYGLLLINLKQYDLAQEQAIIAYNAGFPLNGLKNKLKRVNHWPPKVKPVAPTSNTVKELN